MPAARDDYLMRLLTQAAAALRRLRERLADGGAAEDVIRDASAAISALLGPQRPLLERLDPASAAQIAGSPDTVRAWSGLLMLQADGEDALGHQAAAQRLRARARALTPDIETQSP